MENTDIINELMGNFSRDIKLVRMNHLEAIHLKYGKTDHEYFRELISELDIAEEIISELTDRSTVIAQTETTKKQVRKKVTEFPRDFIQYQIV